MNLRENVIKINSYIKRSKLLTATLKFLVELTLIMIKIVKRLQKNKKK